MGLHDHITAGPSSCPPALAESLPVGRNPLRFEQARALAFQIPEPSLPPVALSHAVSQASSSGREIRDCSYPGASYNGCRSGERREDKCRETTKANCSRCIQMSLEAGTTDLYTSCIGDRERCINAVEGNAVTSNRLLASPERPFDLIHIAKPSLDPVINAFF